MEERKNDISFDLMVDETLTEIVANGEVVITSYTLPWLTRIPLTFWLSASAESRSERMAERDNIDVSDALKIIQSRDNENRRIYKNIYGPKFGEDFQVFDIVLNTELLSLEALIDISKRIVKKIKR
jgi:cytidylate kinase